MYQMLESKTGLKIFFRKIEASPYVRILVVDVNEENVFAWSDRQGLADFIGVKIASAILVQRYRTWCVFYPESGGTIAAMRDGTTIIVFKSTKTVKPEHVILGSLIAWLGTYFGIPYEDAMKVYEKMVM